MSWERLWQHTWPLLVAILAVLAGGLAMMLLAPDDVSDEAIAALIAGALGIIGTHVGHVSGRSRQ